MKSPYFFSKSTQSAGGKRNALNSRHCRKTGEAKPFSHYRLTPRFNLGRLCLPGIYRRMRKMGVQFRITATSARFVIGHFAQTWHVIIDYQINIYRFLLIFVSQLRQKRGRSRNNRKPKLRSLQLPLNRQEVHHLSPPINPLPPNPSPQFNQFILQTTPHKSQALQTLISPP